MRKLLGILIIAFVIGFGSSAFAQTGHSKTDCDNMKGVAQSYLLSNSNYVTNALIPAQNNAFGLAAGVNPAFKPNWTDMQKATYSALVQNVNNYMSSMTSDYQDGMGYWADANKNQIPTGDNFYGMNDFNDAWDYYDNAALEAQLTMECYMSSFSEANSAASAATSAQNFWKNN